MAEVLGLTGESPQYDGFLETIPFSEIHSINFAPLAGANGLVYRAKWTCPQKIDMPASEIREVALKTTRLTALADERKFLSEVSVPEYECIGWASHGDRIDSWMLLCEH